MIKETVMRRVIPRNKPIATVIKNYIDKKSGKVTESRDEIERRFYGLDWKVQKRIVNAFLDAGKTDRHRAYAWLLDLWDPSFERRIKELWEEHHEDRCAWVIIRHFPLDYIKEHTEELSDDRNYYFICRRLVGEASYEIDRNKLDDMDYLMVLYHAGKHIEDAEAKDILYGIVQKICTYWWPSLQLSRYYRPDRNEMMAVSDFEKVSRALYYLESMGNEEVVNSFRKWDETMQASLSQSTEYADLKKQVLSDHDFTEMLSLIVQKNLPSFLPEKYKNMSNIQEEEDDHHTCQ
jgi:hypothetical protein